MKMLNCVLFYEDSFTPIQFEDQMTILSAKMLICESLEVEYNSIQLLMDNVGQLDTEDLIELPLSVFELDETVTYNIFLYDDNKREYFYKHCCSKQIIGNIPVEQIGFKLTKESNLPICLLCSNYCHKGEFDPQKDAIIKHEFICRCSLSESSKCHFDFGIRFEKNKELLFITIKSLLYFHSEAVRTFERSKKEEIEARIANRKFEFDRSIKHSMERVNSYNDKETLKKIIEVIPIKEDKMSQHDYIKVLLHWFKRNFFTWCDKPICSGCKSNQHCNYLRTDNPNDSESIFIASRTEVFKCNQCHSEVRFPRYNKALKLLETKTGRCGEWANLFGCILNAVGYEVRFVDNFEDHVWNEFYSEEEKRWIHVDPCEEAFDTPLLYEQGWGRVMSIILAYHKNHITDVTQRYIKNWNKVSKRHSIAIGDKLEDTLVAINMSLKENLPQSEREKIEERELSELKEFSSDLNVIKEVSNSELIERQSGNMQWRKERGEFK